MDELERKETTEEVLPEEVLSEEENFGEEPAEGEAPETGEAEEETQEDQTPGKPAKPIKGPRLGPWLMALLMMLFGLMMLFPAFWFLGLGIPALTGLANEAVKNYESASSAYDLLYQTEMGASGLGISDLGFSTGNFYYERQFALSGKREGPFAILQSETLPSIASVFPERVPKHLRKLAAQCGELTAIYESINAQLEPLLGSGEEPDESEWTQILLTAIEAAKAQDENAEANSLYYETIILQNTAGDSAQKKANLARIAALKKDKNGAFWMYEGAELYFALQDEDYEAIIALCDSRLQRNLEDYQSMQYKVKALNLNGNADEALKVADKYAKRADAEDYMQLAKAEIRYRQGKYDEAIAICDAIMEKADFGSTAVTPAQAVVQRRAAEAADVKCIVLLLQGETAQAVELMESLQGSPYNTLAAYAAAGQWESEEAQNLIMMLGYYGYPVPQAITDLSEGKTTVENIFTDGWGGFLA